jgi:TonB-linked SusC/RagA family outer membrane protein
MVNSGDASEMGRKSYVSRLNYSYKEKYLLETTLRADASAKFPSNKRWGYFPSISAAWVISQEKFMKNISILDFLKLRASYGESGNDAVGNFQYLSGYNLSVFPYGGTYLFGPSNSLPALVSSGLANPDLTWEKITIYNAGIDFSLWKRKLVGEGDVFYRTRTGIPASLITSLPSTFGSALPPVNLNSLNDRGFEVKLGTEGKVGDIYYNLKGNISYSRSKWDHFEEPEYADSNQNRIFKNSGRWTDRSYGYISDGLFTSQSEIDALKFNQDGQGNKSLRPGDIKYKDINGDGVLNWKDQQEIGKGNVPHWMTGLNTELKYKNFNFSALFQGAFGYYAYVVVPSNSSIEYDLRWTQTNNNANALMPRLGGAATNNYVSDYYYKKAGYVRLKTASLGYDLPSSLLSKIKCSQFRIYIAGTNLITLDKLQKYGIDPEAPSGFGGSYYPQQRTITVGLNISL